ncbi:MAG: hypothetical protein ABJA57_00305 [Ginsengibacter sp.]
MRKIFLPVIGLLLLASCSVFRKKVKYGCPTDGKNIGAERILSGDKEAIKASKKAKKFSN